MTQFLEKHTGLRGWLCMMGGSLLYALSLTLFLDGNDIAAGGLAGIALVLNRFLHIRLSVLIIVMNIPLLLVGMVAKGWRFIRNTLVCFLVYTVFVEVGSHAPTLTRNPLVAAVFGGAMLGVGMMLMTLGNGSIGGTELINRVLASRFPNVGLGKIYMMVDGAVVVFSMAAFRNIEVGLYAILTLFIGSRLTDWLLQGFERGNLCLIITDRPAGEVAAPLLDEMHIAVTKLEGLGMYAQTSRSVLLAAVRPAQTPQLKEYLKRTAPDSFVVVIPVSEVLGGQFKHIIL